MSSAAPSALDALARLAAGDWNAAAGAARLAAAEQPDSRLAEALARFLGAMRAPGVYDEPTAFESFISHGGNVELYRQTIGQLSAVHAEVRPRTVLDIGCGDGRVIAAVLHRSTTRVDLVEPSAALLTDAVAAVERHGLDVVAHQRDVTTYFAGLDATITWDLVQATFALHATITDERPALLRTLAQRTSRLLIVEFDIPAFDDRSSAHLAYLADRYERGVREYEDHPEVIAGFLMPVLVGQLDPTAARYTYEQPADGWARLVADAGFATATQRVADYWWGDAVMISGESHAPRGATSSTSVAR